MSISLLIYLASVSGNLGTTMSVIGFVGLFIVIATKGAAFLATQMDESPVPKIPSWPLWMFGAMVFIASFLPNKETIYMMAGAAIVEDIAESPEAARIGDRLIILLESKLDQAIADIPATTATVEVDADGVEATTTTP